MKRNIGIALVAIVGFCAVWMGLDFIHHKYGRETLNYTMSGIFGLLTVYLMFKNMLVWLEDQQANVWWLTTLLAMFCLTVMSMSRLTNYFNMH